MAFNKSGSVLIISFWTMIVLSLMAYGIANRVNAQIRLARHQTGKVQARYAAYAGLFYVMEQIQKDLKDTETRDRDTLYDCGVSGERSPVDVWGVRSMEHGSFQVARNFIPESPGLSDETGKININGLTDHNYRILKELLKILYVPEEKAEEIAASVVDWKDADDVVRMSGAEQDYYLNLDQAYYCKNSSFQSLAELMLIKGMTPEIYEKIKPYVTVYPSHNALKVNFNTASESVLKAVARSFTGAKTNTSIADADSVVEKIIDERAGADGEWGTGDDVPVSIGRISFSGSQIPVATMIAIFESRRSLIIRAEIIGKDSSGKITSVLTGLIDTAALKIVSLNLN